MVLVAETVVQIKGIDQDCLHKSWTCTGPSGHWHLFRI